MRLMSVGGGGGRPQKEGIYEMCGGVCDVCVWCVCVCVCVCVCWGGVVPGSPPEWAIVFVQLFQR